MKRTLKGLSVIAVLLGALSTTTACADHSLSNDASTQTPDQATKTPDSEEAALLNPPTSFDLYQARYPLTDTHTKLVDNRGNGFEPLYGVRNFRAVLNGVVYRGGANNSYNKYGKRGNSNPLPTVGLNNLCKEGFGEAVYLYPTNYASAPHEVNCQSFGKRSVKLTYSHLTPFSNADVTKVFTKVQASLDHPEKGPIYLHCWNGWHASGLISALILRQFCGMGAEAAVSYWNLNTDGNAPASQYGDIRARIRAFKPIAGFQISAALQRDVCPAP